MVRPKRVNEEPVAAVEQKKARNDTKEKSKSKDRDQVTPDDQRDNDSTKLVPVAKKTEKKSQSRERTPAEAHSSRDTEGSGQQGSSNGMAANIALPTLDEEQPQQQLVANNKRPLTNKSNAKPSSSSSTTTATTARVGAISAFRHDSIIGTRILSAGAGDQIGHGDRQFTRGARAMPKTAEDGSIVDPPGFLDVTCLQVVAGGVHSIALVRDNHDGNTKVLTCGEAVNGQVLVAGVTDGGSVNVLRPLDVGNSPITDTQRHGKIIQLTAGGSFSAALTAKGSIFGWGSFRASSGLITDHVSFAQMLKCVTLLHDGKKCKMVEISAGDNHLLALSEKGDVYSIGSGEMGQLGRLELRDAHLRRCRGAPRPIHSTHFKKVSVARGVKFDRVWAGADWSVARATTGHLYTWGNNNFLQLGISSRVKEEEEWEERQEERRKTEQQQQDGAERAAFVPEDRDRRVLYPELADLFPHTKKWVHVTGRKHLMALTDTGELYATGNNQDNAFGLNNWRRVEGVEHNWRFAEPQQVLIDEDHVDSDDEGGDSDDDNDDRPASSSFGKIVGVTASLGTTIAWTDSGKAFGWGCDTVGQLAVKSKDDGELYARPKRIRSKQLDGYKVVQASLADSHTLFLAAKKQ